jgi:hypothetical protein
MFRAFAPELSFSFKAPTTPSPEILAPTGRSAIRAVIGGNDVRKGWFERLVENAATAS